MAPHSSTLVWQIPWMEEPGRLQSMGLLGVGHEWVTSLSLFTFMHWRRKWQPTPCSCLENTRDGGAWWDAVYRVTQSRTRLKWLSSSSRNLRWFKLGSSHSRGIWFPLISKWCPSGSQPKAWGMYQRPSWIVDRDIKFSLCSVWPQVLLSFSSSQPCVPEFPLQCGGTDSARN